MSEWAKVSECEKWVRGINVAYAADDAIPILLCPRKISTSADASGWDVMSTLDLM